MPDRQAPCFYISQIEHPSLTVPRRARSSRDSVRLTEQVSSLRSRLDHVKVNSVAFDGQLRRLRDG